MCAPSIFPVTGYWGFTVTDISNKHEEGHGCSNFASETLAEVGQTDAGLPLYPASGSQAAPGGEGVIPRGHRRARDIWGPPADYWEWISGQVTWSRSEVLLLMAEAGYWHQLRVQSRTLQPRSGQVSILKRGGSFSWCCCIYRRLMEDLFFSEGCQGTVRSPVIEAHWEGWGFSLV